MKNKYRFLLAEAKARKERGATLMAVNLDDLIELISSILENENNNKIKV